MERHLAAILVANVVGYARLIRNDEEGTITALKALRADLIDPKIVEHPNLTVAEGALCQPGSAICDRGFD